MLLFKKQQAQKKFLSRIAEDGLPKKIGDDSAGTGPEEPGFGAGVGGSDLSVFAFPLVNGDIVFDGVAGIDLPGPGDLHFRV